METKLVLLEQNVLMGLVVVVLLPLSNAAMAPVPCLQLMPLMPPRTDFVLMLLLLMLLEVLGLMLLEVLGLMLLVVLLHNPTVNSIHLILSFF